MTTKELDYMKALTIEWLRRGIKTFDERIPEYEYRQSRIDASKFSAMLEDFVNILDESWEEK